MLLLLVLILLPTAVLVPPPVVRALLLLPSAGRRVGVLDNRTAAVFGLFFDPGGRLRFFGTVGMGLLLHMRECSTYSVGLAGRYLLYVFTYLHIGKRILLPDIQDKPARGYYFFFNNVSLG